MTHSDLGIANYRNHIAALDYRNRAYMALGERGEFVTMRRGSSSVHWCRLGDGVFNTIYGAQLSQRSGHQASDWIAEVTKRTSEAWNEPTRWFVSPLDRPAGIGDLLLDHGWTRAYAWAEMGIDIVGIDVASRVADDVVTEQVTTESARREWAQLQIAGYDLHGGLADFMDRLTTAFLAPGRRRFHMFMARTPDGVPVGAGAVFVHQMSAGVYMVATHPEHRRRGVAGAVMRRLISEAKTRRCRCCVLQSSDQARSLYSDMGFAHTGMIEIYRNDG